jgi:hypothetical protein
LLAWRYGQESERLRYFDRYALPAFDAHAYLAMAERPDVFTVAPWGYRWLWPALVHLLPGEESPASFLGFAVVCLAASGWLLYAFLLRVGARPAGALVGLAAFLASEPVRQTFRDPMLAEPLGGLLWIGVLLAFESGGLGAAALLLTLGALTKEVFLLFLPGVVLLLRPRLGLRRAVGATALAAVPALVATALLRFWWIRLPPSEDAGALSPAQVLPVIRAILSSAPEWGPDALMLGVLPLALLGAARAGGRPLIERYGLLAVLTFGLPFAAGSYVGSGGLTTAFFTEDVARLLLYAFPCLLPLALHALGFVGEAPARTSPSRRREWAFAVVALAVAVAPLGLLDRYRRADLRGPRDGRRVLAFCRQSLAFARRIDRGRLVDYQVRERRFYLGRSYPHYLEHMRWFLLRGWGHAPHYGTEAIEMHEPRASFVLPCFDPKPLQLVLDLGAASQTPVRIEVNGRGVGRMTATPEVSRERFLVPREALFRGDNLVTLVTADAGSRVRLELVRVRSLGAE